MASKDRLGTGLYAASEIARFTVLEFDGGTTEELATRWLRGVVDRDDHTQGRPDYSFRHLISVFAIAALRREGVSLQRIREAQDRLSQITADPIPFARGDIFTDGRHVFARLDVEAQLSNLNVPGEARAQEAMRQALEGLLRTVEYDEGQTVRTRRAEAWAPGPGIRVDPEIRLGAPCIAGTRIPTATISRLAERTSIEDIAWDYELEPSQVRQAVEFERRLRAA